MQVFGKFSTNFDMDYLVEQYMYINENEDEKITFDDLENMLKKKRKTVAGTVFLYNPEVSPVGYKMSRFLQEDGFDKYDEFVALNKSPKDYILMRLLKNTIKASLSRSDICLTTTEKTLNRHLSWKSLMPIWTKSPLHSSRAITNS